VGGRETCPNNQSCRIVRQFEYFAKNITIG
jgi:hypothetical protein